MRFTKPNALKRGDTIALISPASAVSAQRADVYAEYLKSAGYFVRIMPHATNRLGFLAGRDEDRAADIMAAFCDDYMNAIFCIRGGYGTLRLLPLLDFEEIAKHTKIFSGFSDITVLHTVFNNLCGFVTFHAPMSSVPDGDINPPPNPFAFHAHLDMLSGESTNIPIPAPYAPKTLCSGRAEGLLTGGNLTLLASLAGTPYAPATNGRILVVEDVGEQPYAIDRALQTLRLSGMLNGLLGVVIGDFTTCAAKDEGDTQTAFDVLSDTFTPLGIPIIYDYPTGHIPAQVTLPMGCRARIIADDDRPRIELLDCPVRV